MSVYPLQDPHQPDEPGESDPVAAAALGMIGTMIEHSPLAREQFQAARHYQAQARQLDQQADTAREHAGHAQARAAAEQLKGHPSQHIPRGAGTALAVGLAVLDAVPAYWSAQAFGLDQASTIIITVLLCAALGGAMWLLDLFTSQRRRRALRTLQASLTAGLLALFVLRLEFLEVTGAASFWVAAVQALALTALSAVLVTVGYVLLAHRIPKTLSVAQRAARQASAASAAEAAREVHAQASASRDALEHTAITWALTHAQDGISHDQLLPAARQALTALLNQ